MTISSLPMVLAVRYYEKDEAEIQNRPKVAWKETESSSPPLDATSTTTTVVVLPKIRFDENRATLTPDALAQLAQVADTLQTHPEFTRIIVDGLATATEAGSQGLAAARASAVVADLTGRGVAPERLVASVEASKCGRSSDPVAVFHVATTSNGPTDYPGTCALDGGTSRE